MAIDILRRKATSRELEPKAVGELDVSVFSCPSCARPLVEGARRCPGCRTRLVMGIQLGRAALFMALGVSVGTLIGGTGVALTLQGQLSTAQLAADVVPGAGQGAAAAPITEPVGPAPAATVAAPAASAAPPATGIPPAAVWSLGQTAEINARIVGVTPVLASAIGAKDVDTAAVASALRAVVADTASGADLSSRLGAWPAASGLAADFGKFYAAVRAAALTGLAASMSNDAAYRSAAASMLGILGSVSALDARSRVLAQSAGVTLVPVAVPFATDAAGPSGPGSEPLP